MVDIHDLRYDELDIKISLGDLLINILYLRYVYLGNIAHISNHCHSSYELHFIPTGRGKLIVGKKSYNISPGTFYMTGPGVYHMQEADVNDPMMEYCLNFELIPVGKKNLSKISIPQDSDINIMLEILQKTGFWFGTDDNGCIELFKSVMEELRYQKLGYFLYINNTLMQILINTIRSLNSQEKSHSPLPSKIPDDKRRFIFDIAFTNDFRTLTPEELARKSGVCVRQLNRIMKKYYSTTFNKKLLETRLEYARDLLSNTQLSIEEIAAEAGFSSSSYFCRTFRDTYTITTSQFRDKSSNS